MNWPFTLLGIKLVNKNTTFVDTWGFQVGGDMEGAGGARAGAGARARWKGLAEQMRARCLFRSVKNPLAAQGWKGAEITRS